MATASLSRPTRRPQTKGPFDVCLEWACARNWALVFWNCTTLPVVGLIYWTIISEGLRAELTVLGTRLYKIPLPGFSYLRDYEGLHSLDLAHAMAILLMLFVLCCWVLLLKVTLFGTDDVFVVDERINRWAYFLFLSVISSIMIVGDALIFWAGIRDRMGSLWGESSGFVPIIATLLYSCLLAACGVIHVHLAVKHKDKQLSV